MKLEELRKLMRGDVVGYEDAVTGETFIGLVVTVVDKPKSEAGVHVRWEDGDAAGPYRTVSDAKNLSIVSRVGR